MENYRQMIYRYSTGQGPSFNLDLPKNATEYASYKFAPLQHNLGRDEFPVHLKREADRVSMQVETANRIVEKMGWNSDAGRNLRKLKARLGLIKQLYLKNPLTWIRKTDLEYLVKLYQEKNPKINEEMKRIIEENKNIRGVHDMPNKKYMRGKDIPRLYDSFGKRLNRPEKDILDKNLSGIDCVSCSITTIAGGAVLAFLVLKTTGIIK